ncbi:hypothetical protein TNCV_590601 [Trichonephila clavipes]|nr:hypothetical protein TNCV_590601 [Trichonephila clavipes]
MLTGTKRLLDYEFASYDGGMGNYGSCVTQSPSRHAGNAGSFLPIGHCHAPSKQSELVGREHMFRTERKKAFPCQPLRALIRFKCINGHLV